jgi:WD40 repeat protein/serine/threonine protein kinase
VGRNCLSEHELRAFHLGLLPADAVDALAEHLQSCVVCEAALGRLEAAVDPVLAALRQPITITPQPELSPGSRPVLAGSGAGSAASGDGPAAWPTLPGYEVLAVLGAGGMGVVYKARHLRLNRLVALKQLRAGVDHDLKRSRSEAETLAQLQHPNIVQIHEIVEHQGRTFLVLELIEGGSLAAKLAGRPQAPQEAARMLQTVARAVHYAHQRGIIHRDLKPANILLHGLTLGRKEEGGGRKEEPTAGPRVVHPSSFIVHPSGEVVHFLPKVSDFGLAKRLSADSGETRDGDILGTPSYMAPEQAGGKTQEVGPATDVYALGAVLYELLTGRVPLQGLSAVHTLILVRTEDPVPPRRLQPRIPRDLETICLKCLEKEPKKRYASAQDLADDLHRFLAGEPVQARPTPAWERAWKWTKRRPVVAALAAAVVLVAALGFALVAWQWRRALSSASSEAAARKIAQEKEEQEKEARRQAEKLSARISLNQGINLCESGEVGRGLLWLARALQGADRVGDADLEHVARRNLAAWQPFLIRRRAVLPHRSWVWAASFSPDGKTVLTGSYDQTARLWDAATGRPRARPLSHAHPVWAVAWSPDGKVVLTGSGAGDDKAGAARLWDAQTGKPLSPPLPHPHAVFTAAFSPDGQTFLTACLGQVRLWRTADCLPLGPPLEHPPVPEPQERVFPKLTARFSPDGKTIASGGEDGLVRLWDPATGKVRRQLLTSGPVLALAFSPDGRTLLSGSFDGGARLWDAATGTPRTAELRHRGRVKAVGFSPDGALLVTAGAVEEFDPEKEPRRSPNAVVGGEVRLWRAATGRALAPALAHPQPVWSVAFSPGGRLLLTGCEDMQARFFLAATGAAVGTPLPHEGTVTSVAFRADGCALTTSAGGDGAARLWEPLPEPAFGKVLVQGGNVTSLAFGPAGRLLLAGSSNKAAWLWDLAGRPAGTPLPHESDVWPVAFSPDGHTFLTGTRDGIVRLWEHPSRRVRCQYRHASPVHALAFSPDGSAFLSGSFDGQVHLRQTADGQVLGRLADLGPVLSLAFRPDGQSFVLGGESGVQLRDRKTLRVLRQWRTGAWSTLSLYPDGEKALVISDGFARVWAVSAGLRQGPPPFHPEGGLQRAAFSRDGRSVLTCGPGQVARLWDVASGKTVGPVLGAGVGHVAFSPDGRRLAVGGEGGRIALWEPLPPVRGTPEEVSLRVKVLTGLELDDQETIRTLDPTEVRNYRRRLAELLREK